MEPRSFCRNSHGLGSPMLCFSGNVVVSTHAAQLVLHGHTKTSAMDLRDCGCQSANARSARSVMHGVLVPVVLQDSFGPKSNVLPNSHGSLWPQLLRLRQVSLTQPTQRQLSGSGNRLSGNVVTSSWRQALKNLGQKPDYVTRTAWKHSEASIEWNSVCRAACVSILASGPGHTDELDMISVFQHIPTLQL